MPQPSVSPGFRLIHCPHCAAAFAAHSSRLILVHGTYSIRCPADHQVWLDRTEAKEWDYEEPASATGAASLDRRHYSFIEAARRQWTLNPTDRRRDGQVVWVHTQSQPDIPRRLPWWSRWRALWQSKQR